MATAAKLPITPLAQVHAFADIFSISITCKPVRPAPQYLVAFPCGETWQIDRHDWSFPIYVNGDQIGVECCPETLREATMDAASYGATISRIKREAS